MLTIKPMLYVANVSEDEIADPSENEYVKKVREFAATEDAEVLLFVQKLKKKLLNLKGKKKQCSYKN